MRNVLFVLAALVGGLVGYAASPGHRVDAQTDVIPFDIHETVTLVMEDGRRTIPCSVGQHRGDFLSCRATDERPATWYNLRFVVEIRQAPAR